MQYMHDNLKMHTVFGGKMQCPHYDLIHAIYGRGKCNTCTKIYGCTLYLVIDLWMVGLRQMPHSNQDTQTSIESYHGALKCWYSLET